MKYNSKKVLLVAAGMAVAGLALTIGVRVVTGKTSVENRAVGWFDWLDKRLEDDSNMNLNSNQHNNRTNNWINTNDSDINQFKEKITKTFPASIKGIDVEVNLGDITVKRNNTEETIVTITPRAYQRVELNLEENEIKLEVESTGQYNNSKGAIVEILVGKNVVLYDSDFDLSLGNITMENIVLQESDITLSLGDLKFTGDFLGENNIESSLGDVNLTLIGNKSEYRWNLHNSMGTIYVDGEEISDFMSAATKAGTGKNYIEVESSMGDTTINFK